MNIRDCSDDQFRRRCVGHSLVQVFHRGSDRPNHAKIYKRPARQGQHAEVLSCFRVREVALPVANCGLEFVGVTW